MKESDINRMAINHLVGIARATTAVSIPLFPRRLGVIVEMPDQAEAEEYKKMMDKNFSTSCTTHRVGRYVMLRH